MSVEFRPLSENIDGIKERIRNNTPMGHFHLESLDRVANGIRNGRVVFLAAEPGGHKTTLFGQLIDDAAADGIINIVSTIDVETYNWVQKSISRFSNGEYTVDEITTKFNEPHVQQLFDDYAKAFAENIIFIEEHLTAVELGAIVGKIQTDHPNQKVILWVDYLQIMKPDISVSGADERLAVKQAVMGLRNIAKAYQIPVFAISTINRTNYWKSSGLESLGASSQIEYDADEVLRISVAGKGDELAKNKEALFKPIVITALKNRYSLSRTAKLILDAEHATFMEVN